MGAAGFLGLGISVNNGGNPARRAFGILPMVAAIAVLVSACSEVGYPAVHDMPGPRADTPLTPDQVKEATDALISQRDRLSTEAQGSGQPNQSVDAGGNTGSTSPQKTSASTRPVTPAAAYAPAQTAGAESKP